MPADATLRRESGRSNAGIRHSRNRNYVLRNERPPRMLGLSFIIGRVPLMDRGFLEDMIDAIGRAHHDQD